MADRATPLHLDLHLGSPEAAPRHGANRVVAAPGAAVPGDVAALSPLRIDLPGTTGARCAAADGAPVELLCPVDSDGASALEERVAQAARGNGSDRAGMVFDRVDAWYGAGPWGAGFCDDCARGFAAHLRDGYGDHFGLFDAQSPIARDRDRGPFHRDRETWRLEAAAASVGRAARRARDEARLNRGANLALGARISDLGPLVPELARHFDFLIAPAGQAGALQPGDAWRGELLRALLGRRPAVLAFDPATGPNGVRARAAMAAALACDAVPASDLDGPAADALAEMRAFLAGLRARYHPAERLAEAYLLYSARSDLRTPGRHLRAFAEAAEALSARHILFAVRTEARPSSQSAEPWVLAECAALPPDEAQRLARRVADGASLIVIGEVGAADAEGRPAAAPFPDLEDGMNRVGKGAVYALGVEAKVAPEALPDRLARALAALHGRARPVVQISSPVRLLVRGYLDPDRKLDLHLVNLDYDAGRDLFARAEGVVLQLAGAAAGASRTGTFHAPGAPEARVALNPFGFGLTVQLPPFESYAVLSVPR